VTVKARRVRKSQGERLMPEVDIGDPYRSLAWTPYDPTEGRLDSDDPLGFAAAALRLADRIMPGLTVRTIRLGYYPMICAGCELVETNLRDADDGQLRDYFLVWEKLWALSRVCSGRGAGVLGVQGASRHRDGTYPQRLDRRFLLLQRQAFLGALGSYGTSLESIGLKVRGASRLTDAGRRLGALAWRSAAPRAFGPLRRTAWESIHTRRDRLAARARRGATHDVLARIGNVGLDEKRTLRRLLFEDGSARAAAIRLTLPRLRGADLPDRTGLQVLAAARSKSEEVTKLREDARLALALEDLVRHANFALERVVVAVAGRNFSTDVSMVLRDDSAWPSMEREVHEAARRAVAEFARDHAFAREHAEASVLAERKGADFLLALVERHDAVMRDRSARRWLSLEGSTISTHRLPQPVERPEPIRHSYRFEAALRLAQEGGL
jgi:hypothetical protein